MTFPHPLLAREDGILCVGGDLNAERLRLAYSFGIFPWYNPGTTVMWWFPNPRMVLFPEELKVSKSMRPYFNQKKYHCTYDKCFEQVINNCRNIQRKGQDGTWISIEMMEAYIQLHREGLAHSVEVWDRENKLVGGLYGISVGKIFFGESMFSIKSNASKFALIHLVRNLKARRFKLIDCQQETPHLAKLGARPIAKETFFNFLKENLLLSGLHEHSWKDWTY